VNEGHLNTRFQLPSHESSSAPASAATDGRALAISIQALTKRYATREGELLALDDLNADVAEESFVAIVGPSGCGKSTLLKILAGLQGFSGGSVSIRKEAVRGPRKDIGIVFQSPVLFPWRSVIDNVLLPVDVQGLGRTTMLPVARELLALVGLKDFERRYPWELSGGMQQRVAIARALVNDPNLLLMDEPFGALDAMTREHMNVELQRIWLERRKTVVLITHSIAEAVYLADRVLVMSGRPGRFVDDVAIDFARPRPLEIMNSPEFGAHVARIRALFNLRGGVD
jgi:NitT/TauT family transport system ATP-binding protein